MNRPPCCIKLRKVIFDSERGLQNKLSCLKGGSGYCGLAFGGLSDRSLHSRHDEDWFRPFVEHLVCTSKTKGCKSTFKCDPTPYKTNTIRHKNNLCVERHPRIALHKKKYWGKGKNGGNGWRQTK